MKDQLKSSSENANNNADEQHSDEALACSPQISLEKSFSFEAAHRLYRHQWSEAKNLLVYGKCSRVHGHTYRLVVKVKGVVGESGMVIHFSDLKKIVKEMILGRLDHAYLNDLPEFSQVVPTAENIILWIKQTLLEKFSQLDFAHLSLEQIRLYETETSSAIWEER